MGPWSEGFRYVACAYRSQSSSPTRRGKGAGGGGGDEHADWLVTLGEQLGGLQAQMQTTASTSSLQAVQHESESFPCIPCTSVLCLPGHDCKHDILQTLSTKLVLFWHGEADM